MSRKTVWRRRVPLAVSVGVVGVLALVGVVAVLGLLHRPVGDSSSLIRPLLAEGSYPVAPVPVGQASPEVAAEGWVNDPPQFDTDHRLVVLDIWSSW